MNNLKKDMQKRHLTLKQLNTLVKIMPRKMSNFMMSFEKNRKTNKTRNEQKNFSERYRK